MNANRVDIFIKNGEFFDPETREPKKGNIGIKHGQIVAITRNAGMEADIEIDASGSLVLPGFMDMHAHLRDMEQSYKETIASGTKAAVHGGVTSLFCMPNTKPPLSRLSAVQDYIDRIRAAAYCNVGIICGYPKREQELEDLRAAGVLGVKLYMERSLEGHDWQDDGVLGRALGHAFSAGLPVHVHPGAPHDAERDGLRYLEMVQGNTAPLEAFSAMHSMEMEAGGLDRVLRLASKHAMEYPSTTPVVHACHVSCVKALNVIAGWKNKANVKIVSEVTPHHLFLNNTMPFGIDSIAKVLQPLRSEEDMLALQHALISGTVDIIASDHAPHAAEEKLVPMLDALSGFPVLDAYVPLLLTGCSHIHVPLGKLVSFCCETPSMLAGLDHRKGAIKNRYDADVIIVKKTGSRTVDSATYQSQSKVSPYQAAGVQVEWDVTHTIIGGDLQVEGGILVGQPRDRLISTKRVSLD